MQCGKARVGVEVEVEVEVEAEVEVEVEVEVHLTCRVPKRQTLNAQLNAKRQTPNAHLSCLPTGSVEKNLVTVRNDQ